MRKIFPIFCLMFLFLSGLLLAKEEYPFLGLVTHDQINVRAGASINFEALCQLAVNEKVSVVGKSYNWYKIILPKDATGYVYEKYVTVFPCAIKVEGAEGLITANRVNIRAKPGDSFSIIGQINKGEQVKILKESGRWYSIEPTENCFGWVHEKFIRYFSGLSREPQKSASAEEVSKAAAAPDLKLSTGLKNEHLAESVISAVGVIQPMGRVFNRPGTHKLVADGKVIYFLVGDRARLDSFINYRVKIVGEKSGKYSSKYPVILANQITACQ